MIRCKSLANMAENKGWGKNNNFKEGRAG